MDQYFLSSHKLVAKLILHILEIVSASWSSRFWYSDTKSCIGVSLVVGLVKGVDVVFLVTVSVVLVAAFAGA
jgi:hypothetical protein